MDTKYLTCTVALTLACATGAVRAQENGDDMVLGAAKNKSTDKSATLATKTTATTEDAWNPLRAAGGAIFLLGLLGGTWLLARRYAKGGTKAKAAAPQMEVLQRLALGPKRELLMVRAGGRQLVIAVTAQDVRLVTSLPTGAQNNAALTEALAPAAAPARREAPAPAEEEELSFDALLGISADPRGVEPRGTTPPRRAETNKWPGVMVRG